MMQTEVKGDVKKDRCAEITKKLFVTFFAMIRTLSAPEE